MSESPVSESQMSKIMRPGSFAFICLLTLSLAACDNASDRPQTALSPAQTVVPAPPTTTPPAAAEGTPAMPRQHAPALPVAAAPDADRTFVKPAGVNPGKLAEHAKGLEELGYLAESIKLYSHACNWGHTVSCGRLADLNRRLALQDAGQPSMAAPAIPAPPPARVDKPEVVAAVATRHEISRPAAQPVAASPAVKTATSTSTGAGQAGPKPAAASLALSPPVVAQPSAQTAVAAAQTIAALPSPTQAPAFSVAASGDNLAPSPVSLSMQAMAKPPATTSMALPASQERKAVVDAQKLSQQAERLERIGYTSMAIKLYKDACLAGDGPACKRLGEIYIKGSQDVARDYAESVRWYEQARHYGMAVPNLEKRTFVR